MKKYKLTTSVFIALIMSFGFSVVAFANSSWVWISEKRPYDILPFVIIGTLLIETLAVKFFDSGQNFYKVLFAVTVGNILSFIAPYIIYANFTTPYSGVYSLSEIIDRGPFYTVGTVFLLLTVLTELPFVYFMLRKQSQSKTTLALTILFSNIITTALVAVTERFFCYGQW